MTTMRITWVFLLFGIVVLAAIAGRVYSGRQRRVWGRPRSVPGKAVRAFCFLAGLGAFAAVGVATFLDVPWAESMEHPEAPTVLVGDPMTPPPMEQWESMKAVEEAGKLLIHVVAYRSIEDTRFPAHAETFEFSWPEDKQKEESRSFTVDSTEFSIKFCPNFLWWKRVSGDATSTTTTLESQGHLGGEIRGDGPYNTAFGSFLGEMDGKTSNAFAIGRPSSGGLSLARTEPMYYALSVSGEFVAKDAALTSIPVDEYLDRFPAGRGPQRESMDFHIAHFGRMVGFRRTNGPPGLALFTEKAPASWVLLAGVWLLSMAFRRRALAFAGWTLMAVLLCVTLDRATMSLDLARAWEVSAKPVLRAQACSHATATFFYSKTAKEGLEKIAASGVPVAGSSGAVAKSSGEMEAEQGAVAIAGKSPNDAQVRAVAARAAGRL